MRKKTKNLLEELLCGSLGQSASAVLKHGASANLTVDGEQFSFVVKKSKGVVTGKGLNQADFTVLLSHAALSHLVEEANLPEADLATIAIEIVQGVLSKAPERAIDLKIHAGPLVLWQRGYLNLLFLGGKPLMGFLTTHGIAGVQEVLALLKQLRS